MKKGLWLLLIPLLLIIPAMQLIDWFGSSTSNKIALTFYFSSIVCELWAMATLIRCRARKLDFVTVSAFLCSILAIAIISLFVKWSLYAFDNL